MTYKSKNVIVELDKPLSIVTDHKSRRTTSYKSVVLTEGECGVGHYLVTGVTNDGKDVSSVPTGIRWGLEDTLKRNGHDIGDHDVQCQYKDSPVEPSIDAETIQLAINTGDEKALREMSESFRRGALLETENGADSDYYSDVLRRHSTGWHE